MGGYQSLVAWQRAHRLCLETFRNTCKNDPESLILAELRWAALRVPANLVKACVFRGDDHRRFDRYLALALAFAVETEYLITAAAELEHLPGRALSTLRDGITETLVAIHQMVQEAASDD